MFLCTSQPDTFSLTEGGDRSFIVMQYNILADTLCHDDWFPYTTEETRAWDYRRKLIQKKVLSPQFCHLVYHCLCITYCAVVSSVSLSLAASSYFPNAVKYTIIFYWLVKTGRRKPFWDLSTLLALCLCDSWLLILLSPCVDSLSKP